MNVFPDYDKERKKNEEAQKKWHNDIGTAVRELAATAHGRTFLRHIAQGITPAHVSGLLIDYIDNKL